MRIGGGFDYSNYINDYNSYRLRSQLEVNSYDTEKPKADTAEKSVSSSGIPGSASETDIKRNRLLGLEDVSLSFNKNDDFELIGSSSDITGLDIEKAVSDAKKDDILTQYRSAERALPVYSGEDGTVIAK